jgi:hypothetical protein
MCRTENLPAFNSVNEQKTYYERYCPRISVKRVWLCEICGKYHAHGEKWSKG